MATELNESDLLFDAVKLAKDINGGPADQSHVSIAQRDEDGSVVINVMPNVTGEERATESAKEQLRMDAEQLAENLGIAPPVFENGGTRAVFRIPAEEVEELQAKAAEMAEKERGLNEVAQEERAAYRPEMVRGEIESGLSNMTGSFVRPEVTHAPEGGLYIDIVPDIGYLGDRPKSSAETMDSLQANIAGVMAETLAVAPPEARDSSPSSVANRIYVPPEKVESVLAEVNDSRRAAQPSLGIRTADNGETIIQGVTKGENGEIIDKEPTGKLREAIVNEERVTMGISPKENASDKQKERFQQEETVRREESQDRLIARDYAQAERNDAAIAKLRDQLGFNDTTKMDWTDNPNQTKGEYLEQKFLEEMKQAGKTWDQIDVTTDISEALTRSVRLDAKQTGAITSPRRLEGDEVDYGAYTLETKRAMSTEELVSADASKGRVQALGVIGHETAVIAEGKDKGKEVEVVTFSDCVTLVRFADPKYAKDHEVAKGTIVMTKGEGDSPKEPEKYQVGNAGLATPISPAAAGGMVASTNAARGM